MAQNACFRVRWLSDGFLIESYRPTQLLCLQSTQERLSELRRYSDMLEADAKRLGSENEAKIGSMTSQLMTSQQELAAARDQLRQAEKQHQQAEKQWKTDTDRLQVCSM